jgi:lysozyme
MGGLAQMTRKFEGFRDKAYKDIAGKWTIGVGHLIKPGENFSGADSDRLMKTFNQDLIQHVKHVLAVLKVDVNANQLKALADLAFNIGDANFDKSTLLKKLNAGDADGAARQFAVWNKIHQGTALVPSAALTKRRADEANLFRTPGDQKTVTVNVKSDFHIDGSGNPDSTARAVDSRQRGTFSDLTRNLAGAFE